MKRRTNQRNAIQEVFLRRDHPMSIEDILKDGRKKVPSLNQATVYRNVKALVARGWLKRVNTPALGTLYEREGKEHHHHFQCRSCDHVFELPGCTLRKLHPVPSGFVIEGHEIFLFGLCAACRK
jgi:Fur family ferric uptake transcriptional regulator